jgi:hypothetical protein
MDLTVSGITTPGGSPDISLVNPPSTEAGPMDSGGGQTLLANDPFRRSSLMPRSPTRTTVSVMENEIRSQKEQELYNAWILEKTARENLEATLEKMQQQLNKLQQELENQGVRNNISQEKSADTINYETDEEELAKEIGWLTTTKKKANKKRKASYSPVTSPKQQTNGVTSHHTKENNGASSLNSIDDVSTGKKSEEKQSPCYKPPPITVSGITDINIFNERLNRLIIADKPIIKALSGGDIKIFTKNEEGHCAVLKMLRQMQANAQDPLHDVEYHSYQIKSERAFVVVVRGLHYSTDTKLIALAFKDKGHEPRHVSNIHGFRLIDGRRMKVPCPLFRVELEPNDNNLKAYDMQVIEHHRIKVEPPNKKDDIPQCVRCQLWGHTKKHCARIARCVKCAGKHLTSDCKKPKETPPACVNCEDQHPASFKGCKAYKDAKAARNMQKVTATQRVQRRVKTPADKVTPAKSFASVARDNARNVTEQIQQPALKKETTLDDIMQFLQKLDDRLTKLENLQLRPSKPKKKKTRK